MNTEVLDGTAGSSSSTDTMIWAEIEKSWLENWRGENNLRVEFGFRLWRMCVRGFVVLPPCRVTTLGLLLALHAGPHRHQKIHSEILNTVRGGCKIIPEREKERK